MRLGSVLRPLLRNASPKSPSSILFLFFLIFYLTLIHYCRTHYYGDPTSFFFDPARGYQRYYSIVRQRQADAFIDAASSQPSSNTLKKDPKICLGIATVARDNEQYVRATIGSLLEGLTASEREEIYLAVLIAHTDPALHPIYNEPWLTAVADKVLLYDVTPEQKAELETWERERNFVRKAIFDYTYALQKCADTGAEWVAMVEDDTIAVTQWYPRAIAALAQADDGYRVHDTSVTAGGSDGAGGGAGVTGDWLYLRMFYTEEFLGWNAEEWPTYLFVSATVTAGLALFLLVLRKLFFRALLTDAFIGVACLVCTPALILLYFLAGRQSVQPLRTGVSEMPRFGCCAQGLIFSSHMAPKIATRLKDAGAGFVDELIEAWANELDLVRWVVAPSLLQHVGAHSSKGDDMGNKAKYDRSVAEKIWNFGFEAYDERVF